MGSGAAHKGAPHVQGGGAGGGPHLRGTFGLPERREVEVARLEGDAVGAGGLRLFVPVAVTVAVVGPTLLRQAALRQVRHGPGKARGWHRGARRTLRLGSDSRRSLARNLNRKASPLPGSVGDLLTGSLFPLSLPSQHQGGDHKNINRLDISPYRCRRL